MIAAFVASMLERELRALRREVEAYPDERQLWQELPGVGNTGGTLALHIAGNLQHYIGARLGGTGYVRDRPAEFSRRGVSRVELLEEIDAARTAVAAALARLTEADLHRVFPEPIGGVEVETGEYLIHLAVHATYHLGQIDLHRRVVTGRAEAVDAVRPAELSTARKPSAP
jgi:uncharacterized damage-inducible protein DinB